MKIRILFGTPGWPSGLLEVGSWAAAQGLAQVVIRQIHPAKVFEFSEAEMGRLCPGPLPAWVQERFSEAELGAPAEARLVAMSGGWLVEGGDGQVYFYIFPRSGRGELWDACRLAWPICRDAIRQYEAETGQMGRFVYGPTLALAGNTISQELWEALGAVGGAFLERLIRFRPHVVGFRLEGADEDEVAGFIRACRLFSKAEIVLGGPTATSHPIEVLQDLGADYVFAGEAEETFAQFLQLARKPHSRDLAADIPGLAYSYGGRWFHNTLPQDGYGRTAAETPADASAGDTTALAIGWPDAWQRRHRVRPMVSSALLEANRLDWTLLEGFDRPMKSLFFIGSRGCPAGCTFCAKLHGVQVRGKSAGRLLEEIEEADACVQAGQLQVQRWPLFAYTDRPDLQKLQVAWAAVYDEDFFLLRDRAIHFFELWDRRQFNQRYRLSFQTNPRSLLDHHGQVDQELLQWIDRLKPMIQLGGESFHPEQLARWRKRHTVAELHQVADALESTHQDYTVFILLSDFDSTPEELLDAVWLLVRAALGRPGMRIASSPFTIPLYDSQIRRDLEYRGLLPPGRVRTYRDYLRPQPGWMNPWTALLADLADAELHFALQPAYRDAALVRSLQVLVETIRTWAEGQPEKPLPASSALAPLATEVPGGFGAGGGCGEAEVGSAATCPPSFSPPERIEEKFSFSRSHGVPAMPKGRARLLLHQAEWALNQVRELLFHLPVRRGPPPNADPNFS